MKNHLWFITLIFLMTMGCSGYISQMETGYAPNMGGPYFGNPQEYGMDMDMDSIYSYLSPYGNWINMRPYGYVWIPRHMGYRWRPYSDGHWVMTDYGWTWIANEEWGAIPFHYGRWGYDDSFGWFWVPGMDWGPAWVSWRWSDQYVGWAPMPPGVEFRTNRNFASISINIPNRFWIFLQTPRFLDQNVRRYTLPYERNPTLIIFTSSHRNMYYRNNMIYNEGIGIDVVRRVVRREVPHYRIRDIRQPRRARITGNDLQVYRPNFRTNVKAKPKVFLNSDRARQELAPVKVFEPRQQAPPSVQRTAVRRRQVMEKTLLKKTQAQEMKNIQRKRDAELAKIRDKVKKTKIKREHQTKIIKLQKRHQVEKQQLTKRIKQDLKQVAKQQQKQKKKNQKQIKKKKK